MVSRVIPVDPFDLVIFGGTGDLARRKILPGLYRRFLAGQMTADSRIIGAARGELSDDDFRTLVAGAIQEFVPAAFQDKADPGRIPQAAALCGDRRAGRGRLAAAEGADARGCGAGLLFLGRAVAVRRYRGAAEAA
jgi:hypothetical protein